MDLETIATYNQMSHEYGTETAGFWQKFPQDIINEFSRNLAGTRVLDVGSGPGRDGLKLQSQGIKVHCLDASEAMCQITNSKKLPTIQADFLQLPFAANRFDGVWAYTSLLHTPKSSFPNALAEIYRVLKFQGILGLGLIEGTTEEYTYSSGISQPRLFAFYQPAEISSHLKQAGFEQFYFDSFQPKSRNYLHFLARKV